jgi:hypothetical protein
MAPRAGWKKVATTVTLTASTFTLTSSAAQAFFPPWWPTDPPVTVVPPTTPPTVVPPVVPPPFVPPTVPPPIIVPPTVPPPIIVPPTCPPPHGVPEPSTLACGLAGMAAAAGWAARRRNRAA